MFAEEVKRGDRFQFGKNWESFLARLTDERVQQAERALTQMLQRDRLDGLSFLDAGSGSGLSSLAARRLGARVHSFDYDPSSVSCTNALRARYFPNDEAWAVEEGSVLDPSFLGKLPRFDVVYSWGVLHHTGAMWQALDLVAERVAADGLLLVALYNDQGQESVRWREVKKRYNALPPWLRSLYVARVWAPRELRALGGAVRTGNVRQWVRQWTDYQTRRGMSRIHDLIDWVGGYPFEVAKPEDVVHHLVERGYSLFRLRTVGSGLGCNEFVFRRCPAPRP